VLGGGGVVGLNYHAAALATIEQELGWDPRTADVIVGTSAGSLVGAMLRRGIPAGDLSAVTVGEAPVEIPAEVADQLAVRPEFPPVEVSSYLRRPRTPNLSLFTSWTRRPWRVDPLGALMTIVPDGSLDLAEYTGAIRPILADEWPHQQLWITAVRQSDLKRMVFGRDLWPSLADAVHASCSIPGYFRPVRIQGHRYVDGGVRSPTNADVLRHEDHLDLVIVLSPMSGHDLAGRGPFAGGGAGGNVVRRYAKGKLDGEIERLEKAGLPVVTIEPGPEVAAIAGTDFMSHERADELVRATIDDTAELIARPFLRTLLAGLSVGATGSASATGSANAAGSANATGSASPTAIAGS
jgi:NTE family protein